MQRFEVTLEWLSSPVVSWTTVCPDGQHAFGFASQSGATTASDVLAIDSALLQPDKRRARPTSHELAFRALRTMLGSGLAKPTTSPPGWSPFVFMMTGLLEQGVRAMTTPGRMRSA